MGHHIDSDGRFQSDKHPELPPDKLLISFTDPFAWAAFSALALAYNNVDHEFATDIRERLTTIGQGSLHE